MSEEINVASPSRAEGKEQKAREEYLLKYEERLLDALKESCKSVNQLVATCYAVALLVALVVWQSVNELSVFGAKLPLSPRQIPLVAPLVLFALTVLLAHELLRTQTALTEIQRNSVAVTTENSQALPIALNVS